MKKSFLLAGAAMMVLASCSNEVLIDDPVNPVYDNEINFCTFNESGSATRASKQAGYTFNVGEKISVYGYEINDSAENQIFDNQMVENTAGNTGDKWAYSPKKYWQSGNTYEFYAAYPYEQGFKFDSTKKQFSLANFTVNNDTAKQIDLMIAERNLASPNKIVEFRFHHILSNVNFLARVSSDVNPEEITSVDIIKFDVKGLLNTGSYAQTETAWTANHQADGFWTVKAPKQGEGNPSDYYKFPAISGGQATALKVGNGYPVTPLATDMLLMPQKLFYLNQDGYRAEQDPTIEVEFKVSYSDNTYQIFKRSLRLSSVLAYQKKTLNDDGSYTTTTVNEPIYEWLPNYKYVYTVAFNPAKTTRIWDSDSDGGLGSTDDEKANEKEGGSKYNIDTPNVIQVLEDTDGDGTPDTYVEYPVVWEDIDGDGKLEGGVDKDGDGKIDNVDGDNTTKWGGDDTYDPTDGDDVNNPDGKDVILVFVDTDGDGEPDDWRQLEKDPETGEIIPGKETEENYIEFTATVVDWEVEYDINYEITK